MAAHNNDQTQLDTVDMDISSVNEMDILVSPILRLIFVPSCQLFQEQIWSFKDQILGPDEKLLLQFTSVLYQQTYPLGNFSANYGIVDINNNYHLYNELKGEAVTDPSLGVILPNGQYTMTCYNYDVQSEPTSIIRLYFQRGVPVGTGVIIDLVNNRLFLLAYGLSLGSDAYSTSGLEVNRRQYQFINYDTDTLLALASPTNNILTNLSSTYSGFTPV